jgi:Fic-DOC domain mobile mystery protein B
MDPLVPTADGHTAISDEDRQGLIPTYIATRGDLNDAEQRNIVDALIGRQPKVNQLLDDTYLRNLHLAMFARVWTWAGSYRQRETNIGIDPAQILVAVRQLVGDAGAWVERGTYQTDELGVRFHHRLVAIHPFRNGNGRHGRIAADLLVEALGATRFSWGARLPVETTELRDRYVRALRRADNNDFVDLLDFARA